MRGSFAGVWLDWESGLAIARGITPPRDLGEIGRFRHVSWAYIWLTPKAFVCIGLILYFILNSSTPLADTVHCP